MLTEPALGQTFFGRENILSTLEKRVNALKGGYRQNVALTGQMLAGKSSILSHFLYTLKDSSLVPIYIEVVEEPFRAFADKFIATLIYSYLINSGHHASKDISSLLKMAETVIPHTTQEIKKVKSDLSSRRYNNAYRKLFHLTSVLRQETGKSCVVILDEFHNLEFLKLKKPYLDFGKIIMIQKDTMYVVSSSQKNTIKKILSEKLALLYGNFEVIEVSGFDDVTARSFVRSKLSNIDILQKYVDYIVNFTDGNPFYLDVITKKIGELLNARKIAFLDKAILVEAVTSMLYTTNGTLNQYFTNTIMSLLEKDLRTGYLDILTALSLGHNKLKDIAAWLNKKSSGDLNKKLSKLIELDIVFRNGSFCDVHDKIFKFWLSCVHHKKKTSLIDDVVNRTEDFKNELNLSIDDYLNENSKIPKDRIRELLLLFDGELVEIDKKQKRFPKFIEVEAKTYGKTESLLAHQESGKLWVCEIWNEKGTESCVSDFFSRYYYLNERITKRVCIALNGIDRNALLLAKEKNISVWDLKTVNTVLKLYKKQNIMNQ